MKKLNFENIKKCCKNCGKLLILKINRDILKKNFCSRHCSSYYTTKERQKLNPLLLENFIKCGQTEEVYKKKGLKGKNHPKWKGGDQLHICKLCNNKFLIPIHRSNKGYGQFCSRKCWKSHCKSMRVKTNCLTCGKDIFDLPKKNRKYCSCSCRAIDSISKQKFTNTDIELKLKGFLEEQKITFEYQPLIKDIVNADFLVYPNIVIFADGDYWHSLPSAVSRDKIVNEQLNKNQYKVLRFSGSQIKKNFNFVKTTIMETYNARKK